ncbi:MAG: hypothetical protein ACTIIK_10105, partial [Corynebacterium casei]|uniref:hypothetical protein n=1 Tax=Corynebacterium casei TaxID=160386 RepID=UPI003F95D335
QFFYWWRGVVHSPRHKETSYPTLEDLSPVTVSVLSRVNEGFQSRLFMGLEIEHLFRSWI